MMRNSRLSPIKSSIPTLVAVLVQCRALHDSSSQKLYSQLLQLLLALEVLLVMLEQLAEPCCHSCRHTKVAKSLEGCQACCIRLRPACLPWSRGSWPAALWTPLQQWLQMSTHVVVVVVQAKALQQPLAALG
jgi:hypothetical protein